MRRCGYGAWGAEHEAVVKGYTLIKLSGIIRLLPETAGSTHTPSQRSMWPTPPQHTPDPACVGKTPRRQRPPSTSPAASHELLYQAADETPRCIIIVRMPTPPSAGTLLARMRHRAIQLAPA